MNKILIDTMHIYALLTSKDNSYVQFSQALDDEKIRGVISVTTLAELLIFRTDNSNTRRGTAHDL